MLTNITEGYQKKCEQYWPQSKQSEEYWPFEVTVVDQMVFADYTVRTMQLEVSSYFAFKELHKCTWEYILLHVAIRDGGCSQEGCPLSLHLLARPRSS